jgi:hypothetical protein
VLEEAGVTFENKMIKQKAFVRAYWNVLKHVLACSGGGAGNCLGCLERILSVFRAYCERVLAYFEHNLRSLQVFERNLSLYNY